MNIVSTFYRHIEIFVVRNHDFAWYFIFSYRSEITYPFKSYKTSRTKRKKMCLTKYVLSRQFSGTCVTQNSDYHLRYELCFIIYVRKHKKFTINSVPGIEAFKMIIMMLRKKQKWDKQTNLRKLPIIFHQYLRVYLFSHADYSLFQFTFWKTIYLGKFFICQRQEIKNS